MFVAEAVVSINRFNDAFNHQHQSAGFGVPYLAIAGFLIAFFSIVVGAIVGIWRHHKMINDVFLIANNSI